MAGNSKTCPAQTANVYVDKIKPTCTNSGDSESYAASRTIVWGCSDADSKCHTSYDGGSTTFNTETVLKSTIAGYEIRDNAGNSRNCAAREANVYVDKTAPGCTNSGDSTEWTTADRRIYYGCSDANSGCDPNNSGGSILFNTTTTTATIPAYIIKDNVGNQTNCPARTANVYVSKTVYCGGGYYLPANSQTCTQCPANSWCPGGTYNTYQASAQGKNSCSSGYSSSAGSSSRGSCCKEESRNCCSAGTRFDDSSSQCVDQDYYNGPECGVGWECVYGTNQHCYGNAIAWHPTGGCYGTNCWCMNVVGSWGPYCFTTTCE